MLHPWGTNRFRVGLGGCMDRGKSRGRDVDHDASLSRTGGLEVLAQSSGLGIKFPVARMTYAAVMPKVVTNCRSPKSSPRFTFPKCAGT